MEAWAYVDFHLHEYQQLVSRTRNNMQPNDLSGAMAFVWMIIDKIISD